MRKSRYTEEQIIGTLKEVEAGAKVQEVIPKRGITEQTFYRWKSKFGGMEVSDARPLRARQDENRRPAALAQFPSREGSGVGFDFLQSGVLPCGRGDPTAAEMA